MPQNWVTDNIPGAIEYLSGDPNAPGFDASHGSESNYHDHFAFRDEATTRKAMKLLQDRGIQVTEFGVKGGHSPNSHHYSNRAFDVPGAQWGGSGAIGKKEWDGSKLTRQILLAGLRGDQTGGTKPLTSPSTASPTPTPQGRQTRLPGTEGETGGQTPGGQTPRGFRPEPFEARETPAWLNNLRQEVMAGVGRRPQHDSIDLASVLGLGSSSSAPAPVSNPPVRGALDGTRVGTPEQLQIAYGHRADGIGVQESPAPVVPVATLGSSRVGLAPPVAGREDLMRTNTWRRL
jgi:hypothetical protein